MAKDPAFLFYSSDFLTGTMFMTDEQVGIYIRLLCAQHQHGGLINKIAFNSIIKDHLLIRDKFIETEDGFFNQRLLNEMIKRKNKSESFSKNAIIRWEKEKAMQMQCKCNANAFDLHMPIEDEDVNKDVIDIDIKEIEEREMQERKKEEKIEILPPKRKTNSDTNFIDWWCEEYQNRFTIKYVVMGGKEGSLVKKLLEYFSLEELKELATYFFNSTKEWYINNGYKIGIFYSEIQTLSLTKGQTLNLSKTTLANMATWQSICKKNGWNPND